MSESTEIRVYSDEELERRSEKKKNALKNLAQNIRRLRSGVNENLKSDNEKNFLTALAIYMMLETSERVGNEESADNGHFGITGLKKSHVTISNGTIKLNYVGKSGVKHEKTITSDKLARLLSRAIANSPSTDVFVTSDGFKIKNDRINRHLSSYGVTAKDIRGYSANKWILSGLKRTIPAEDEPKRKKQFNEIVKKVAEKVGHGSPTLKKHYLLPEVETNWIEKGKVIELKSFKAESGGKMQFGGQVKADQVKSKTPKSSYFSGGLSFLNW